MEKVGEGLIALVIVIVAAYVLKLDMADITGLSRKAAADNTKSLAKELGYTITSSRSSARQDVMEKQYKGYRIAVDGDHSQIEVEFKRSLGLRASSLKDDDMDAGKLEPFSFNSAPLEKFFVFKAANQKMLAKQSELEATLLPLVEQFDARQVKYLYIQDEYLRIGFAYRSYLPAKTIHQSLPLIERTSDALKALQDSRKGA